MGTSQPACAVFVSAVGLRACADDWASPRVSPINQEHLTAITVYWQTIQGRDIS